MANNVNPVKTEKPKREPIVKAKSATKGTNGFAALRRIFLADDVASIKEIIFNEVIIPSIRDTLYNGIENALHILLYGQAVQKKPSRTGSIISNVSYNMAYKGEAQKSTSVQPAPVQKAKLPNAALGLNSEDDANDLKAEMMASIEDYGYCSVLEFKEWIGEPTVHTDENYGWTNLEKAKISRYRDADEDGRIRWFYSLELPKPGVLDFPK